MGLFFNYDKPGKGVEKDAPKKKGIFLYAELWWRKLSKLILANMLYFLVSLPVIAVYHIFSVMLMSGVMDRLDSTAFNQFTLMITAFLVIFLGTGPVSCGYTFLLRNFAREEHVWLASDFFQHIKENFKHGLIIFIADIAALIFGANSIIFYYGFYKSGHKIGLYMMTLVMLFMMIYVFAHYYYYQFAVTFYNKTSTIFKNSIIMAIASLPMNLFLTAFVLISTYFVFGMLTPIAVIMILFVFWISFMRFPIDFYSARVIQKRLIEPQNIDTQTAEESDE